MELELLKRTERSPLMECELCDTELGELFCRQSLGQRLAHHKYAINSFKTNESYKEFKFQAFPHILKKCNLVENKFQFISL